MGALYAVQEQLQEADSELQQYQSHGPHHQQHPHQQRPAAPGTWPSYDTAVQHLQQQLPAGSFFGRLFNCISITDPSVAGAVNAALQEVGDLNRTLVVSDRQAATAVINHFRQQRIGTVQCKILSELQTRGPCNSSSSSASPRPLLAFISAAAGLPTGFQALLDQLLGGWLLVNDRQEANRLLHLRKNMVTR